MYFSGRKVIPDRKKKAGMWKVKIQLEGKECRRITCPSTTERSARPFAASISPFLPVFSAISSLPFRSIFYHLNTSSTGQWSEPITSVWISADTSLSFKLSDTQK